MESIQDVMKKLSTRGDMREEYQKILNQVVYKDPEVLNFIEENEEFLSEESIKRSSATLYEFVTQKELVKKGQPGLIPGHYPRLYINNGNIEVEYVPTKEQITREQNKEIESRIESYFMPRDIRQANFDNMEQTQERISLIQKSLTFLENYLNNPSGFHKSLYIHGAFGTGKTYFLGAIARELSEHKIQTTLVHYPTFAVEMKNSIGNNTTSQKLEIFKQADVLMIDDIGAESSSSWIRDDILGVILQYRMQQELPTFFTSNFSMKELEKHLTVTQKGDNEPLKAKRLMERVQFLAEEVELTGKNYRQNP